MDYKLMSFRFEPGGGHSGSKDAIWSTLVMNFTSEINDSGNPHLRLDLPLPRDLSQTFGEQEQQARDHAIATLKEALCLLDKHSLEELRESVGVA